ncbi:UbiA-like polyprenyltransferase [Syntrophobacter fumaroxidans]|uniref:4-hydroxybenzoate polyprenyltransferase n=1 Tax=Syntrophobacter fumaroxidans (strain DSM 10017 / MPOB) TaxID=335543 RepID=A0LEY7_SYNFM|nr:UbiA-like polyprenyltransferase [Syntrophobacter fumaroxidans]ABK15989.1 4-hydroxybenzoate polyprenyltransferase, putative [Syntrophobacter fumaroxidans MPOB]
MRESERVAMLLTRIRTYGRLIKFSHTIFALPFALAAVLLANRHQPVSWATLAWIVLAMASARSAAMGFNRLADYEFDRRNPRTSDRPLTSGAIDRKSVLCFIFISSSVFVLSAAALGRLCFVLSVPVLLVLFFYSYTKRFTAFSHLVLGFGIGLAPIGAWIAVTGSLTPGIVLLSLALMTYIAGFDILYACQDIDFDRQSGLFSLPARWGASRALTASSLLHAATFLCLLAVTFAFSLGRVYLLFLALISLLLIIEHLLVRPDRLDRVNVAFFHVNSAISVLLFVGILADVAVY